MAASYSDALAECWAVIGRLARECMLWRKAHDHCDTIGWLRGDYGQAGDDNLDGKLIELDIINAKADANAHPPTADALRAAGEGQTPITPPPV